MQFIFSRLVLIRHLWQLNTVAFLHWCLICTVLMASVKVMKENAKVVLSEFSNLRAFYMSCNCTHTKRPNLKLKTWPKQLLGFLL